MALKFINIGGPWDVLPPGIHDATLPEIERRFAINPRRKKLCDGFRQGSENLMQAGCRSVYLDGSFVTGKEDPGDFDACWDPIGVDATKLDPVLLDFSDGRKAQKKRFGGEFFPSTALADGNNTFLDYFQIEKHTGRDKGIIRLRLSSEETEANSNDHQ